MAVLIVVSLVVLLCLVLAVVGTRRALAGRTDSAAPEQGKLPDDAGAEASPAAPPPPAPAVATQNGQAAESDCWETCEIVWWRGYRKSAFYALAFSLDGTRYFAGRSRDFKWRRKESPPQADTIVAARREFLQNLLDDGWEEYASGESWYASRYRRWNGPGEASDHPEEDAPLILVPANGHAESTYVPSA